jgi:hypothetical protein
VSTLTASSSPASDTAPAGASASPTPEPGSRHRRGICDQPLPGRYRLSQSGMAMFGSVIELQPHDDERQAA